jgi:hypothetical protein
MCPLPQIGFMSQNDFANERPYCAFIFEKADLKGLSSAYITVSADWIVTLGDVCLYYYNKRKTMQYKK